MIQKEVVNTNSEDYIKEYFKGIKVDITLIDKMKGVSRSREDVYKNYLVGAPEVNNMFLYEVTYKSSKKFVIFDFISECDQELTVFNDILDFQKEIEFRKNKLIDIYDEIKLFNIRAAGLENAMGKELNLDIKVIELRDKNYYCFNIYKEEVLMLEGLMNIYDLDLGNYLNKYEQELL